VRFETVLFDLFGTVVHFAPTVPTVNVGGETRRTTLGWLQEAVAEFLPQVEFAAFSTSITAVSKEIAAARAPEYIEVTSRERFRRALLRLGIDSMAAIESGRQLSAVHMRHLASMTVLPEGHRELLHALGTRHRIGLVSNFDDAETAVHILERHGIGDCFESVTISAGFGRRKPHPSIFAAALAALDTSASAALFVGDSFADDVVGAKGAGLAVAWIESESINRADLRPQPDYILNRLDDLRSIV